MILSRSSAIASVFCCTCFAVEVALAEPVSDLLRSTVIARRDFAFEAAYSHKGGEQNFRVVGYDAMTGAWYLIQYGRPAGGVDHDGRSFGQIKEGFGYYDYKGRPDRADASFIEGFVAPSLWIAGVLRDSPSATLVEQDPQSGSFVCKATLPGGNRQAARFGLPPGMKAQDGTTTVWTDRAGLPTQIQRSARSPVETLEFEPTTINKIPILKSSDNGTWTLESVTWLVPGQDKRFTSAGLEQRAKLPDTRPRPAPATPLSPEAQTLADAQAVQSGLDAGIIADSSLTRYRWPIIITGVLLITLGVIAHVRSRRS